jgi:dihydroorotate dehydrogenase (NAD+) catalytic subunit
MRNILNSSFLGISFNNPLILPSGIIQELSGYESVIANGVGGVVGKSLTVFPREGNPLPRVAKYKNIGFINSVGLRNPGIDKGIDQLNGFIEKHPELPVIASIFAPSIEEFQILGKKVLRIYTNLIELNLSCPNTVDEMGQPMGMGVESTKKAVYAVRKIVKHKKKLIAKLSPNVADIGAVGKAAEEAGADALSAINTVGPGMVIDIKTKRPILGNKKGGLSGPAVLPVAVRCVYELFDSVKIPIIGMGGVSTWEDAVEMTLAGASLIGVGSAWYGNKHVYSDILKGLTSYASENNIVALTDLIGKAH